MTKGILFERHYGRAFSANQTKGDAHSQLKGTNHTLAMQSKINPKPLNLSFFPYLELLTPILLLPIFTKSAGSCWKEKG